MTQIADHSLRYSLSNELHARPFPVLDAPGYAAYVAIQPEHNAVGRNRDADRAHLLAFLDRYGLAHPKPGVTHHYCDLGAYYLKWESHTEFVTYSIFSSDAASDPFAQEMFDVFPQDWLDAAPGVRLTSALIRVVRVDDPADILTVIGDQFANDSLAVSFVLDKAAAIASDFLIDANGHIRMAVAVSADTGPRQIGRIVQRLCEIETYKTMSMFGLARAQEISARIGEIDGSVTELVADMGRAENQSEDTLKSLLSIAAELEDLSARSSFRFGATRAYEAIVYQRIAVLREQNFEGRQTFSEFMTRRFDPAMRTVKATEIRLRDLAQAATRAGELLRTRVDVERSAQNQKLLKSMNDRADLQLRLQSTVEGLSVVAISYYAVNLAGYIGAPLVAQSGISKTVAMALITPAVLLIVWFFVRQIRKRVH